MVRVLTVSDRRSVEQYIEVPFRLYRNDPLWVPPLRSDMRRMMSPRKNPLFAEADIQHFVAVDDDGTPLGRISTTIHHDYNRRFGEERAFFGFFESEWRSDVADALFEAAKAWAMSRGKRWIGPTPLPAPCGCSRTSPGAAR